MEVLNGVELYYDDEAEAKLQDARELCPELPPIVNDYDQIIPFVYYKNGFHLWLFIYCGDPKDSGLIAAHIKYFASQEVDFKAFPWDVSEIMYAIDAQIMEIAKNINYRFSIVRVDTEKYVGFRILQTSIQKERTNSDGHLN